jgi:hypothetical protein
MQKTQWKRSSCIYRASCARRIYHLLTIVSSKYDISLDQSGPDKLYHRLRNFAARMYLQQNITITGAGLPRFDDAIESLHIIQSVFAREYQENQLETYHPATHHGFTSIDASNRYFSTRSDISSDDHLVFPTSIDPYGFLHELLSNDLTYAPDNVVQYHQQIGNM